MPLYEYQCDSCGHRFERIRKFSDPPVTSCPQCGSAVQKLVSSPAFHLKGTGWYATDYAKKSGSKSEGPSAESKDAAPKDAKGAGDAKDEASKGSSSTDSTSKESSSTSTAAPPAKAT